MQIIIVTGLSGSGKSGAAKVLEDIGFYCIDNMPPQLIPKFAEICETSKIKKVAIVADVRGGEMFTDMPKAILDLKKSGENVKVLFLDASDDVLIKRYKETRRKHPLDELSHGNLKQAIADERDALKELRLNTDYFVDTSMLSAAQLKEQINGLFLEDVSDSMIVDIMSFGFKYGNSYEADLVFDVRCLPNPYYIIELRDHTGRENCIQEFVMGFEQSKALLEKLFDLIDFLIPLYIGEGKSRLVIAFGCTGGKHRSVTFAEKMNKHLSSSGIKVRVSHRDIIKP